MRANRPQFFEISKDATHGHAAENGPLSRPRHIRNRQPEGRHFRLSKLQDAGLGNIAALPYSIRVLLESVLRNCDGYAVTKTT